MNINKLKELLIEKKLFRDENTKNIISKCFLCSEHPDPKKQQHLWISKNPDKPIYHCFFCNSAGSIRELTYHLTGSNKIAEEVLSKEELEETLKKKIQTNITHVDIKEVKLPELDINKFPDKLKYIQKRTRCDIVDKNFYNNLIFDINGLIKLNPHLNILKDEDKYFVEKLNEKFICFIGNKQSVLFFRNVDENDSFKFFKYVIQPSKFNLLEYICFHTENKNSNLIVLTEGVFNNLAVMKHNILNLYNDALLFASGQSFSYDTLLKSVCFDYNLYKAEVVVLSDLDKPKYCYTKFIRNSQHVINKMRTYYNKDKKDFGTFPISPINI